MKTFCEICHRPLVTEVYDDTIRPVVCNPKNHPCALILSLFNQLWSNEAIMQRAFFKSQPKLPPPDSENQEGE